jgi:hypothetical protein
MMFDNINAMTHGIHTNTWKWAKMIIITRVEVWVGRRSP